MSRSRKKNPCGGMCSLKGGEQKAFRTYENSRERKAVKVALAHGREIPHPKQFGNEWASPRDGKSWWKNPDDKWMRK